MISSTFVKVCKCEHCKNKLKQINQAGAYWENKIILAKNKF